MFTEMKPRGLARRVLRFPLLHVLTGPHGVDGYTELVDRAWTSREARATVVGVRRQTRRSVTLRLQPNELGAQSFAGFRAGQYLPVTVEIDGRRHTRCYSPANAEGSPVVELTVGRHDGGRVSTFLYDSARVGMVVGLGAPAGDFTLDGLGAARRVLLVSGGSGITPVLSMARTLTARGFDGEIAFLHYARNAADMPYLDTLTAMAGVRVLRGFTRSGGGDVAGHLRAGHLHSALDAPDAVFVCGPPALVAGVREVHPEAKSESFAPPALTAPDGAVRGRITFSDSVVATDNDGRSLLEQAEAAGLSPSSGCRMGICHTCTRRKTRGAVQNLITGAVSDTGEEDVQICVSAAVGDVEIAL